MKITSLILLSFLLISCKGESSKTGPNLEDNGPSGPNAYVINYSGNEVISPTTSTDLAADVCKEAGGVYLMDSLSGNSCIVVDEDRWKTKVAEFNQICAADPDIMVADRRFDLYQGSMIDIVVKVDRGQILCPNSFGFFGCDMGHALYIESASDTLSVNVLTGCD